jgi:predicted DNA binding CopG/RHH family protein
MRLPKTLLTAVKDIALREGMPYQRFIRQALEYAVNEAASKPVDPANADQHRV